MDKTQEITAEVIPSIRTISEWNAPVQNFKQKSVCAITETSDQGFNM